MRLTNLLVLASVSVLASAPARALPSDTLSAYDVSQLAGVSSAAISPDGQHVAYTLAVPRTPRADEDGPARTQLHVLSFETGEARAFVTADSGASAIAWTPDSAGIAFLAKRDGDEHRALWIIPVDGGEARRAFAFDDRAVSSYRLAPDGERVAVVATAPKPKQLEADEKDGFKAQVYEEDWRPGEVWIGSLFDDEAEPTKLGLDGHASGLEWAPDGSRLAVAVAPTALVDDSYMRKRIVVVDAADGAVTGRVRNKGKLGPYAWSPDSSSLAVIAAIDEHDGSAARLLWAPAEGENVPTPMLGERERDEHAVAWLADGSLVVRGSHSCWSTLDAYRVADGRASERSPLVPLEGPIVTAVTFSDDGSRAALVASTPTHPSELFTFERASGRMVRRTHTNPLLDGIRFAQQEVVRYSARDGQSVEGVLIHPLEADGPAPLIAVVHGGPEAHLSNGWLTRYSYPGQVAAARGYAVFYPNYRGSTGRGLAYLKLSQGDPAGREFDDVVDGVDHLIEIGLVDRDRVGVTGGSYGGYATGWFSTYYSDRFAAGVMFVGISNKISKVGTTDIADEEFYVHALKRPWDDWQFFLERSPIYYADRGKTPLLILHGKEDTRVDPGQSRELYRHLKLRGEAPVRLVHYPGEGHGNRKAGARFDYSVRMMRWFDHYLLGDGGAPPEPTIDFDEHLPDDDSEPDAGRGA